MLRTFPSRTRFILEEHRRFAGQTHGVNEFAEGAPELLPLRARQLIESRDESRLRRLGRPTKKRASGDRQTHLGAPTVRLRLRSGNETTARESSHDHGDRTLIGMRARGELIDGG